VPWPKLELELELEPYNNLNPEPEKEPHKIDETPQNWFRNNFKKCNSVKISVA
jgi:hypothetical protein